MADPRSEISDEEEEEFNPVQEVGSENGDAEPAGAETTNGADRRRAGLEDEPAGEDEDEDGDGGDRQRDGDDDEEEDEEEDDDEDDEDAVTSRPRKRRRRDKFNQFIEMEAEVDEDEEEDEEEDDNDKGFLNEEPEAENDVPFGMENDDRIHKEMDRRRQQAINEDAEKIAQSFAERYGRRERVAQDTNIVPREFLAPGVDDPRMYGVKVKPGKERDVVFSILKRVEERANSRTPLKIFSAVERGGPTAGFVYVEARQQKDIMEAVEGIMFCYPHGGFVLLPIKEMPDVLRVKPTKILTPGTYVRMKKAGPYHMDLAQVDTVNGNGLEIEVKLVPRLTYGLDESTGPVDPKRKRAAASNGARPPPRAFSEIEAKKKYPGSLEKLPGYRTWKYFTETYIDGFLYKPVKLQHLIVDNVHPTLEEVSRFSIGQKDGTESLDLTSIAASIKENASGDNYQAGDVVEVYEGEQQGLWGKATSVRNNIVALIVNEGELKGQRIEVPAKSLRKRFREGDHVKVIGTSQFAGEVGMVVGIKRDQITFITDLQEQEITVFSKDLRVATDSGGAGSVGQFSLHDLVQLDPATVGCVTKIEREVMRILDQYDTMRNVMIGQISNKIERRKNAVATDRAGNEIRIEDTVKEVEGERRSGTIIHIHRSFVFLMNREYKTNSGVFVTRATNVATVAAKGGRTAGTSANGPDLSRMNPALKAPGAGANGLMPPPRSFGGRDPVIGKTVVIARGAYKGLLGIVKDATDQIARVELHSKNKTLPLDKTFLRIKTDQGNTISYVEFASSRGRGRGGPPGGGGGGGGAPGYGGRTPAVGMGGGRTPMGAGAGDGGRTPAWGAAARTPAWSGGASGGQTPGWGASGGGRTPAWQQNTGGRTAYGGGGQTAYGGRTPAGGGWGGATAYGGGGGQTSYGGATAYGGGTSYGGATYGDNAGGKTPAPALDAPTPGAPTPGAPTPGVYGDAPTPFAGGGGGKQGWGGAEEDDDGPQYTD